MSLSVYPCDGGNHQNMQGQEIMLFVHNEQQQRIRNSIEKCVASYYP